ncbi:MAG: ABC transporter permease subunit [Chloroflexi bacterium]|jgi:peptide/nickel transport system permease protein|nr:ABC transporter permease subunit [Chloroflexota bacterium]
MKKFKDTFQDIVRYPSAVVGLLIVLALIVFSIYTMITIPYKEAIHLWKGTEAVVYKNPRNARPTWVNWFRKDKLPVSVDVYAGEDEDFTKEVTPRKKGGNQIEFNYEFDYNYNQLPQDIFIYFKSNYVDKNPFVVINMTTPAGEEIKIYDGGISRATNVRFGQEEKLLTRLVRLHGRDTETQDQLRSVIEGLFTKMGSYPPVVDKGTYTINVKATTFEEGSDVEAELVMHGTVFGLFGTDHMRRDLKVAIMWGAPIALAFGLTAALGTALISMFIAALGTWFGGWLDELIQRITEVNMVIPYLSILIMVGTFYSRSIWVLLLVTILLNIFSGAIKSRRAIFLQVRESTYIEAAKAYGASDYRIIIRYMIPRVIPMIIPGLVSAVPAYVFLEASLAILGLGDPTVPTWGKIINDARTNGALYQGMFYWILEPAVFLMITGLGFAMLGFALDRIFNPRLRGM